MLKKIKIIGLLALSLLFLPTVSAQYSGLNNKDQCRNVRSLWNQNKWTGYSYDFTVNAGFCKANYYKYTWDLHPNNVGSQHQNRCNLILNKWNEGWRDSYGEETVVHACENLVKNTWNYEVNLNPSASRCLYIKRLWEEGDWTARFQDDREPHACDRKDTNAWHYRENLNPDRSRCEYVKRLWDEGNWTARFRYDKEPFLCEQRYSNMWYKNESLYDNNTNYDSEQKQCSDIHKLFEQRRFSSSDRNFTVEPSVCKQKYYKYTWDLMESRESNKHDIYCPDILSAPKRSGGWHANFGDVKYASICGKIQRENDSQNLDYQSCKDIKNIWFGSGWTKVYGTDYSKPLYCKQKYFQGTWVESSVDRSQDSLSETLSLSDCLTMRQDWNKGEFKKENAPIRFCKSRYNIKNWKSLVETQYLKNAFSDTDINTTEGVAAAYLKSKNVVKGNSHGLFDGKKNVNRAEALKMLLLSAKKNIFKHEGESKFSDVNVTVWYGEYVMTAVRNKIVDGYPDGKFKPTRRVNTVEFVKIMTKLFNLKATERHRYSDVEAGSWYEPYADIAWQYNLFPKRNYALRPSEKLTKETVAVAIYQYLNR